MGPRLEPIESCAEKRGTLVKPLILAHTVALILFLFSTAAKADPAQCQSITVIPSARKEKIRFLEISSETTPTSVRSTSDPEAIAFVIRGKYPRSLGTLVKDDEIIPTGKSGEFSILVKLKKEERETQLTSVGPLGDIESQWISFQCTNENPRSLPSNRRFSSTFGIGASYVLYRQTDVPDFSAITTTGKLSLNYAITPRRWDLGLETYLNLFSIVKSAAETVRFFGANIHIGYTIPGIPEPWRLTLTGGYYLSHMLVTDDRFGFSNLSGPQLYPVLQRSLASGNSIFAYFKFSPVGDGFKLMALSNHEWAMGGGYRFSRPNRNEISLTMDFTKVDAEIESTQTSATSFSLGLSYGF